MFMGVNVQGWAQYHHGTISRLSKVKLGIKSRIYKKNQFLGDLIIVTTADFRSVDRISLNMGFLEQPAWLYLLSHFTIAVIVRWRYHDRDIFQVIARYLTCWWCPSLGQTIQFLWSQNLALFYFQWNHDCLIQKIDSSLEVDFTARVRVNRISCTYNFIWWCNVSYRRCLVYSLPPTVSSYLPWSNSPRCSTDPLCASKSFRSSCGTTSSILPSRLLPRMNCSWKTSVQARGLRY